MSSSEVCGLLIGHRPPSTQRRKTKASPKHLQSNEGTLPVQNCT